MNDGSSENFNFNIFQSFSKCQVAFMLAGKTLDDTIETLRKTHKNKKPENVEKNICIYLNLGKIKKQKTQAFH